MIVGPLSIPGRKLSSAGRFRPTGFWLTAAFLLCAFLAACGEGTKSLTFDPVPPRSGTTHDYLRGYTEDEAAAAEKLLPRYEGPESGVPVPREVQVEGSVFLDANGNSEPDPGEPGLPGVLVSDGERVARTDSNGKFSFSLAVDSEGHHRFVFATQPTGYRPTTAFFQLIRSDETRKEYTARFGFAEDPLSARDEFWFLTTSDTQVSAPRQMLSIAKDYAQMTRGSEKPAFLVTVGDLTSQGTHYEWDTYDFIRAASGVPIYDGYGGHDGNGLMPRSTVNYELRTGPPYYSFDYGGVHFVHFVSEVEHLLPHAEGRQEKWLSADLHSLPAGTPVIAIAHEPLPADWFDRWRVQGVNLICQLSGHVHTVMAGSRNGVPVLGSAPAGEPDWGAYGRPYRRVYVSSEGVRSEVRIAGQHHRLEVVAPGPTAALGPQPLVVVAHDSATTVERVSGRIISPDGRIEEIQLTKRGQWSWHGRFSPETAGRWRFQLEAVDTGGTSWRKKQVIEVKNIRLAPAAPSSDFPWILAGDTPRRVKEGPQEQLYPLWVQYTGGKNVRHAAPAVQAGRVYVAVPDPNAGTPGSGVLCLDAATGAEIWRTPTPMGDIPGAVTVHGDKVYALTWEGWMAAYDAHTGRPLWQTPLKETHRSGSPEEASYGPPFPTEHGLLVSQKKGLPLLLDYETGGVKQTGGRVSTSHYAQAVSAFHGVLYSTLYNGGQYAWRMLAEKPLWEREDDLKSSMGIVVGGKFLFTGCCQDGDNVAKAVDALTGDLIWETNLPNRKLGLGGTLNDPNPVPVVWDDLVLANGRDFAALELETGRLRWKIECGVEPERFERSQRQALAGHSSPLVAGSLAFFGHDDTSVRAVNYEGQVVWEHRTGTPVIASPAVSGNLLYIHDYAGNLWCFVPADSTALIAGAKTQAQCHVN